VYLYGRAMPRRIFLLLTIFAAFVTSMSGKDETWIEVRSEHFTVLSDSTEKQARHVADQFERMRIVFHDRFPKSSIDPGAPIVVLAIKDEKGFRALEPEAYLGKGKLGLAGLFLRAPDKNYVLMRLDAPGEHPYAVVYHEYTHLLNQKAGWLPLWLNEGLAEFYETTEIRDREVLTGQPSEGRRGVLLRNQLLPLPILFAVDANSPYYHEENKGSIFYAESWALTHYLTIKDDHENTNRLADYIKLVSENVDAVRAGTQAFGDLNALQIELEKYIQQGRYYYSKKSASIEVDDVAFKVQALTPAQADAVRADFLAYDQRIKDAKPLLERALRDDPSNVSAHETMGYIAFCERNLPEARKWYDQAIKLDSRSFLAYYYSAAIAVNSGQVGPENKSQVESNLRTAIKLNPSFAPAYDELAVFYGMRRENLKEAQLLALNAVQLDPGNLHYRLTTANILLQLERPSDAIRVLQNAASLAKTPDEVGSLQNLMQSAQQYKAQQEQEEKPSEAALRILPATPPTKASPEMPSSSGHIGNPVPSDSSQQKSPQPEALKPSGDCTRKATAAYGPLEVLTDTMGVDFGPYLQKAMASVRKSWYYNIPESARAPLMKKGKVTIEFDITKNGTVSGVRLISTSGDVALDRGAWAGITGSSPFSLLPAEFTGQYLALRFTFYYNPSKGEVGPGKATSASATGISPLQPCVSTAIHMIGEIGLSLSPAASQVMSGSKQQFSASVSGSTNFWVNWKVSGPGCSGLACGSISSEGLYTAPSIIPNPPSVTVTASVATDPGDEASATVTIVQQSAH
jgi:TonB family protein